MRTNREIKPDVFFLEGRLCMDATVAATVTGDPPPAQTSGGSGDYGNTTPPTVPPPVVVPTSPPPTYSPPYGPLGGSGTGGGSTTPVTPPTTPPENQAPSGPITPTPVYDNPPPSTPPPPVVVIPPTPPPAPEPSGPQYSLGYPGYPHGTGDPPPASSGGSGDYGNTTPINPSAVTITSPSGS